MTTKNRGDNTILTLQAGRALVGYYDDVKRGKSIPKAAAYLKDASQNSSSGKLDLLDIENGFDKVAAVAVEMAAIDYAGFIKKGQDKEQALESCSNLRFVAGRLHSIAWVSTAILYQCMGGDC